MANSRLEKVGNIFLRTNGLLRSGAMKAEERPIWYDLYAAYPPVVEPRFDRPAPNIEIKNIFYAEDKIRAKFHKLNEHIGSQTLSDTHNKSNCQQFIEIYQSLQSQGALSDEAIFETALDMLKTKLAERRANASGSADVEPQDKFNLLDDFKEAQAADETKGKPGPPLDLSDIFKS